MFPILPITITTTKNQGILKWEKKPNQLKHSQVAEFIVSLHSGATRQIQDLQIHYRLVNTKCRP